MAIENEEQKEILLGNKQLLSIFFIVVVLLGISFTIGYVIGKNTATVHAADGARAPVAQLDGGQQTASRDANSSEAAPRATPPHSANAGDTQPGANEPAPSDASNMPPVAAPRSAAAVATHQAKPYERMTESPAAPAPVEADPARTTPAGGTYLQVGALKREDADNIARVLRSRGYPTVLGESSKEGLFRVLVGPFKNMAELSDSKQRLRASGMDSIVAR